MTDPQRHLRAPRRRAPAALATLLLLTAAAAPAAARDARGAALDVLIVRDGPSEALDRATDAARAELAALLSPPPRVTVRDADWTLAGAASALATADADRTIDVLVTVGSLTARAVATRGKLAHPTVIAFAGPATALGLAPDDPRPWVVAAPVLQADDDLARLRDVTPVRRVAVLLDPAHLEALPDLAAAWAPDAARQQVDLVPFVIAPGSSPSLDGLPDGVDALLLGLLPRATDADRATLIAAAQGRRLPVLASYDASDIARGALLTTLSERAPLLRGRQVALGVQSLAEGAPASTLRDPIPLDGRFVVNAAALRALDLALPFAVLARAELVGEAPAGATMSLTELVGETVTRNPGLRADAQEVVIGDTLVAGTRSALLPQLHADATATWIDADRAEGVGPPSERQLAWGLTLSQTLYSPTGFGLHDAEGSYQEAREAVFDAQTRDLVFTTISRYLDLLRARTAADVQLENLRRVRANLDIAEAKVRAGAVGREEIYRWQIDLAQSQEAVVRAVAARDQAAVAVNALRARPVDSPVAAREVDARDLPLIAADPRLERYFDTADGYAALTAFALAEARERSPELRALRAQLDAADAIVSMRRRRFFLPELSLEGGLNHRLLHGGAGADTVTDAPGFALPDAVDWSIAIVARLPLFEGAGRVAALEGANAAYVQLEALTYEQQLAIDRDVASLLHQAAASRQAVVLTAEAAAAAEENLALVRDAYARGAADVIRLVDAQTQSLLTSLAQTNAVYGFLADFTRIERAMGALSVGPDARPPDAFFQALAAFADRTQPSEER